MNLDLDLTKAITDLIAKQQEDLKSHIEASTSSPMMEDPDGVAEDREKYVHRPFPDPGDYDAEAENEIRAQLTQFNHYAEAGDPTYDPSGFYICKSCVYRVGKDGDAELPKCAIVEGEICLRTGSCDLYRHGDALEGKMAYEPTKVPKEQAGYQERPTSKAFGCLRCQYSTTSKYVDHDGRVLWCTKFGCHVQPLACCSAEEGRDSIKTFE